MNQLVSVDSNASLRGVSIVAVLIVALILPNLAAVATVDARSAQSADLVAKIVRTGRGSIVDEVSEALVFQIRANDPDISKRDGAGILSVDFFILEVSNSGAERLVYHRREQGAPWCAFSNGNGRTHCNVWTFRDGYNRWPRFRGERRRIREGEHLLRAVITSSEGKWPEVVEESVDIRLSDDSSDSSLRSNVLQTGTSNAAYVVEDRLVFRARANDPTAGNSDGAGIDFVDLIILDENEEEVYRNRENNAGFCAFGGGDPNCNVYDFDDNDNEWPNGEPIIDGDEYILRTVVEADDGRNAMFDTIIEIRLE